MGHTLTGKLVASFGGIIAIWRLDALNMAKMGQAPIYSRWRLDGTLPLRGQLVSSVAYGKATLQSAATSVYQYGNAVPMQVPLGGISGLLARPGRFSVYSGRRMANS